MSMSSASHVGDEAKAVPSSPTDSLPLLYVDDEPDNLQLFRLHFGRHYDVHTAGNGEEALALLDKGDYAVLLTDERMPGMSGIDLLARAVERCPDVIRIIVSAYGDSGRLLAAMNRGHAHEYVLKPWSRDDLRGCLDRALEMARRRRLLAAKADLADVLTETRAGAPGATPIVGLDGGLQGLHALIRRAAHAEANVLVIGETGTGKELVARTLHELGPRAGRPFLALNCSALPEGLIESELFGHEQGAFTGASKARKGRFELANGGTLFLDEIGDISPRVQVSLLRALQERRIERVGSAAAVSVDVRVVAATHRDLPRLIREGSFREDLYYRLNVLTLSIPPLRERPQDLPSLVRHFIQKWLHTVPGLVRPPALAPGVLEALARYQWPGNVRELENMIQRALIMCDGAEITMDDFTFSWGPDVPEPTVREQLRSSEARELRDLLLAHGGNVSRAARSLGIPRTTLVSRARRLGLI
jgi:DNA-binding NtrC family response regulator